MGEFVKIRMLSDERGSVDGITLRTYYADQFYDLPLSLARAFVDDIKCAEYVPMLNTAETVVTEQTETPLIGNEQMELRDLESQQSGDVVTEQNNPALAPAWAKPPVKPKNKK